MKCKFCHKEFQKKHPSQKFCSRKCKDDYWNEKKPDRHRDPNYYAHYRGVDYDRMEYWADDTFLGQS